VIDNSLIILQDAATKLRELINSVVFVGGATLGLHISDTGAAPPRATLDVDVIAEITNYVDYVAFSDCLRPLGFREDDREGAPTCRWLHGDLILDVMPLNREVLGFANRWYRGALETSQSVTLPNGMSIQMISAPYFLGTKIEAFRNRGEHDFYESRDLEDFVAVIDGRGSLLDEIASTPSELRSYLAEAVRELLSESRFMDALPGYLLPDEISQQRITGILRKLSIISERV